MKNILHTSNIKSLKKIYQGKVRDIYEVDANNIARLAIYSLFRKGDVSKKEIASLYKKLKVDPSKPNPWEV